MLQLDCHISTFISCYDDGWDRFDQIWSGFDLHQLEGIDRIACLRM